MTDVIKSYRVQSEQKTDDIDGKIAILEANVEKEQAIVDALIEEQMVYEKEFRKLEAEVGPVKYIAELVYSGEADRAILEDAVRWVIIIIIFVFDPLAVLLLIAANMGWEHAREDRIKKLVRSQNRVAKDGKIVDAVEMTNPIKEEPTRKEKLEKLKEETEKPKKILKKKEVRAGYEYDVDV